MGIDTPLPTKVIGELIATIRAGSHARAYQLALVTPAEVFVEALLKCGFSINCDSSRKNRTAYLGDIQRTLSEACRSRQTGWEQRGIGESRYDPDSTIKRAAGIDTRNFFGFYQIRADAEAPWCFVVNGFDNTTAGTRGRCTVQMYPAGEQWVDMSEDDSIKIHDQWFERRTWVH